MAKILFFGDSITDMNRVREPAVSSLDLGSGFVILAAGDVMKRQPESQVINRGISGNKVTDLLSRFQGDVLTLNPDVLSIHIGINDVWHGVDFNNGVDIDTFEKVYRIIIEKAKENNPRIRIMLCEPFVFDGLATRAKIEKFDMVADYAKVVKKLAKEYNLDFVSFASVLRPAVEKYGVEKIVPDGVHPQILGAKLMADEWIRVYYGE